MNSKYLQAAVLGILSVVSYSFAQESKDILTTLTINTKGIISGVGGGIFLICFGGVFLDKHHRESWIIGGICIVVFVASYLGIPTIWKSIAG